MAKIFVSLYNFGRKKDDFHAFPPFYESFIHGLKDAGNEVLCFHQKTFTRSFDSEIPPIQSQIIKSFNPDLCILFCNKFWDISRIVDCPILIYDTDSPLEYAGINHLRANVDRYKFVTSHSEGIELLKNYMNAKKENCSIIPFFSEVRANPNCQQERNISFLGTNWLWHGYDFVSSYIRNNPSPEDREFAKQMLNRFVKYPFETTEQIKNSLNINSYDCTFDFNDTRRAAIEISGLRRLHYLSSISDLGLEVRGAYWNIDCMNYFPDVAMCFNAAQTFTLQENEGFYNNSKLSLNTRHIQAQSGFSFRVCDIMASNACLISEESNDLKKLFPKLNIPSFSTPSELRKICKELIANDDLRLEIVAQSQEAINQGHRFHHVLEKMESFCKISLRTSQLGTLSIYSDEDPVSYSSVASKYMTQKDFSAINFLKETTDKYIKDKNENKKLNGAENRNGFVQKVLRFAKKTRNYFYSTSLFSIKKIHDTKTNVYIFFLPFFTIRKTLRYKTFNFWLLDGLIYGAFDLLRRLKLMIDSGFKTTKEGEWIVKSNFGIKKYYASASKYQDLFATLKYLKNIANITDPELEHILEESNIKPNEMTRSKFEKTKAVVLDYLRKFDATALPAASGLVREHQMKLMDLIIEIRDYIDDSGMHLMLTGGNLLGAIRHGGFIPWDDDADFDMIRSEYEQVLPLLKQKYKFCDASKCRDWTEFFKTIDLALNESNSEIICTQTYSGIKLYKGTSIQNAISLDILPIDIIDDSVTEEEFEKFWKEARTKTFATCKNWGEVFEFMKHIIQNSGLFSESGTRFFYGLGNHAFWNFKYTGLLPKSMLLPFSKVDFEGEKFYCPNNIDCFLKPLYGDYMKLPLKLVMSEHLKIAEIFLNK